MTVWPKSCRRQSCRFGEGQVVSLARAAWGCARARGFCLAVVGEGVDLTAQTFQLIAIAGGG